MLFYQTNQPQRGDILIVLHCIREIKAAEQRHIKVIYT
jgi:hypothetical protein